MSSRPYFGTVLDIAGRAWWPCLARVASSNRSRLARLSSVHLQLCSENMEASSRDSPPCVQRARRKCPSMAQYESGFPEDAASRKSCLGRRLFRPDKKAEPQPDFDAPLITHPQAMPQGQDTTQQPRIFTAIKFQCLLQLLVTTRRGSGPEEEVDWLRREDAWTIFLTFAKLLPKGLLSMLSVRRAGTCRQRS